MFVAPESPWRVSYDGHFDIAAAPTTPPTVGRKSELALALRDEVTRLQKLQHRLFADGRIALLLIFQGMDASGKDGTIRRVLTGVNPAGCHVVSFGPPSTEALAHDFLWRCIPRLPERGRIGVFNRSWYEEVLIVRVHPEHLDRQRLPWRPEGDALWDERLTSIRSFEKHLARNGTMILKIFLHLSADEQRRRLLERVDRPEKRWKLDEGDVAERTHWDAYQVAYAHALGATSRPWAPWYAIPADHKPFARLEVAKLVTSALRSVNPRFPKLDDEAQGRLGAIRQALERER